LDACAQIRGHRHGALDFGRVPGALKFHQSPKVRQEGQVTTTFGFDDTLHDLSSAALIQQSVYETPSEQSLGVTLGLSARLHLALFSDDH
jgi:hypothetical protein